eukprot:XP_001179068.1 PREDICTED: cell death protein 3-like [Strongylocentrotus purpuratus]
MDNDQTQNNQHGTAPNYRAKRGVVSTIFIIVSNVLAVAFSFASDQSRDDVKWSSGIAGFMIPILITSCIGVKARNRRKCWVVAYLVMAIISAACAVIQIGLTSSDIVVCYIRVAVTACTGKRKACLVLSLISSFVTCVASITASCIACYGCCSCCKDSKPLVSTQSDNVNTCRVFENEQEPQIDVAPDVDGLYTDWKIEKAEPRKEQFDPEENYVMHTSTFKGLILILNNNHFHEGKDRPGSEVDLENIEHVFRQIGYEPVIMKNLSANEIRSFLDKSVSRINLEGSIRHSSVVLVLMSHGEKRGIYGTDLEVVTIQEIKSKFSGRQCPALLGKPKIFFIQACRGQMRTKSALDTDDPRRLSPIEMVDDPDIDSCSSRRPTDDAVDIDGDVPDNADIYVAYATSEGYFSIRNQVKGSWFIQSLCEELIAHVHIDDLDTIMNRVTRRVIGFTRSVVDGDGKKKKWLQTPDISKQGIGKKIYFMPNYPPRSDAECSLTDQPRSDAACSLTQQPGPSSEPQGQCSTHSE